MKVKTWLYPLVLIVSTLAVGIALIFPLYDYVFKSGLIEQLLGSFGVFTNFMGIDAFPTYVGITGIFASSYLILGFVGLLISVVLTILKLTGFEIKNYALCNRIAAGVALIGTIGFVASAIAFICINYYDLSVINPGAYEAFTGTFALWMVMGGLILGTIASYLGAIDIAHEEKKAIKEEVKTAATAQVVEEKPATKVVAKKSAKPAAKKSATKTTTENKKTEKKTQKIETKKEETPATPAKAEAKNAEPAKKVETKKTAAKPAAVKKAETKKAEAKKTAVKTDVKPVAKKETVKTETKKVETKKVAVKAETKKQPAKKVETKQAEKKVAEVKKAEPAKKVETKKTAAKPAAIKKAEAKKNTKSTTTKKTATTKKTSKK